jgi:ppGpp synthetase/RelA/SpoT-type nucleotidyltranferase
MSGHCKKQEVEGEKDHKHSSKKNEFKTFNRTGYRMCQYVLCLDNENEISDIFTNVKLFYVPK